MHHLSCGNTTSHCSITLSKFISFGEMSLQYQILVSKKRKKKKILIWYYGHCWSCEVCFLRYLIYTVKQNLQLSLSMDQQLWRFLTMVALMINVQVIFRELCSFHLVNVETWPYFSPPKYMCLVLLLVVLYNSLVLIVKDVEWILWFWFM